MTYNPTIGLGIIHLDFTVPQGKTPTGRLFTLPEKAPVPAALIELQSATPSADGRGGIWMDKGSRVIQTDAITTPGRYIINIVGFFEVPTNA